MSATNTTTNYNLPIFIGSDKPSWLADFNGAMTAIDAQMKTNADAIATKSPILTFNDTTEIELDKTGNVVTATLASGVSDKVGRALVTPIAAPAAEQLVAIDTNGAQAAVDIGSGLFNDNGTLKAVDLNLTDTGSATLTPTGGTVLTNAIRYALNSDKSIGKVYGYISISSLTTNTAYTINTNITVASTGSPYDIYPVGIVFSGTNNSVATMSIDATGKVSFKFTAYANVCYLYIMPCIYFFKDFGDTPTP